MSSTLGLYLNSANPDQRWRTLDRAIHANLEELHQFGGQLSEDEQSRVAIRWARQNVGHRVYAPTCPLWGCVRPLWVGPRDFTLRDLSHASIGAGTGIDPHSGSMLTSSSVASFLGRIDALSSDITLVFGGHGDGPYASLALFGETYSSLCDASPSWLTPAELTDGLRAAGFGAARQIQLIGFDNCQQSSLELAIELREFAQYLVVSQLNVPGLGWSYRDWPALAVQGTAPRSLALAMVNSYRRRYDSAAYERLTLTSLELAPMERVAASLRAFCDAALSLSGQTSLIALREIRKAMPAIPMSQMPKVDAFALFSDVAQDVRIDSRLRLHANDICTGLAAATQGSWISDAVRNNYRAYGISIVFPRAQGEVNDLLKTQYLVASDNLASFRATRWPELLSAMLAML